jgi:hypothetical protein
MNSTLAIVKKEIKEENENGTHDMGVFFNQER